jgi:nucleotide-binding universal stress UspA family protein
MINLKLKKIIVPFDFSKTAENAVKYAAFIASYTKGELILVYVQKQNELIDILLPILNIKKPSLVSNILSERLSLAAARIQKEYLVKTIPVFSSGNVTSEIVNLTDNFNADLIVMGTQGSDSKNEGFLGSNTYRTIIKSKVPLLTITVSPLKKGFKKILLPIDLSVHTRQKVTSAIQLAKLFSAQIQVLSLYSASEITNKYKLNIYFKQIQKECVKHNILTSNFEIEGNDRVKNTILYSQKIKADIIISMTDQESEFNSFLLGNYIHRLVNNSKVPVLCLNPEIGELTEGETAGLPF